MGCVPTSAASADCDVEIRQGTEIYRFKASNIQFTCHRYDAYYSAEMRLIPVELKSEKPKMKI